MARSAHRIKMNPLLVVTKISKIQIELSVRLPCIFSSQNTNNRTAAMRNSRIQATMAPPLLEGKEANTCKIHGRFRFRRSVEAWICLWKSLQTCKRLNRSLCTRIYFRRILQPICSTAYNACTQSKDSRNTNRSKSRSDIYPDNAYKNQHFNRDSSVLTWYIVWYMMDNRPE